jgi:methanogenic corrinoid protein MtbC1
MDDLTQGRAEESPVNRRALGKPSRARWRSGDGDWRKRDLAQVIDSELLPRLKVIHHGLREPRVKDLRKPDPEHVGVFTSLLLADTSWSARDYFQALVNQGHSVDRLFLELLAPAAILLGSYWDEDYVDFVQVAAGVARLQTILTMFGAGCDEVDPSTRRRALLMTTPGEEHLFGVAIVKRFMRAAGWNVQTAAGPNGQQIARRLEGEWFSVVGFTLSCETRLEALAASIEAVRRSSSNRAVRIMVGGPVFLQHPEFVAQVGADAAAVDAPTAVLLAQRLQDL